MFSGDIEREHGLEMGLRKVKSSILQFCLKTNFIGAVYSKFLKAFRITLQWDGSEKPFLYFEKYISCTF